MPKKESELISDDRFPTMLVGHTGEFSDEEIEELKTRYEEFRGLFPKIEFIGRERIREIEPAAPIKENANE